MGKGVVGKCGWQVGEKRVGKGKGKFGEGLGEGDWKGERFLA